MTANFPSLLPRPGFVLSVACLAIAAAPALRAQDLERPDRRVYVPIDELDAVLDKDGRGVVLPRDEFEKLYAAARRNQQAAPVEAIISRVDYAARLEGQQFIIQARVTFRHFAQGWQKLTLPTPGLWVRDARLGDERPALGRDAKQSSNLYLLSREPGVHTLELDLWTPVGNVGSDLVAAFGLLPCSSATFAMDLPAGKQLALDGVLMERPVAVDQPTTLTFPVGGRDKIELRLTERERAQRSSALVFSTTAYGINVAPGEVTWQAAASLQCFGEALDRFVFSVPRTLEIAAVDSTGLEAWELADSADQERTEITLTYRQPVDGSRRVNFRGVMAIPVNEAWSVPGLELANAASQIGRVSVRHPLGTRLLIEGLDGVRRVSDQQDGNNTLSRASFDIWQRDFDLKLRLQLREREVLANLSTILNVGEDTVGLETVASLECLNAPLFETVVALPTDWEITGVLLDNQPARWRSEPREAGRVHLRILFDKPLEPGQERTLRLTAVHALNPGDDETASFGLPEVSVLGAGVVEGVLLVRSDPWLDVTPLDVTGLDPAVLDVDGPHLGFRYQDTHFTGAIQAKPKPTRLAVRTESFTRLDPEIASTYLELELDIGGGGLRDLRVQLPESVGDAVRFQIVNDSGTGTRIREQQIEGTADGVRTWLVRFDRRVRGRLVLSVPLEEARADDGNVVPEAVIARADRQHGILAIEASAEQHLTFGFGDQATLPSVDPVELPAAYYRPQERVVAAFRYVRPGHAVNVAEERFDRQAVPTAICHDMALQTVLGESGELQHRVTVVFVAVGVQNLRLSLPSGSTLWSTELDAEPIEVRRDGDSYLVPLRDLDQPDSRRTLQLVYGNETERIRVFGQIQQSSPVLSVDVGGEVQPIETLHRRWEISHPDDTLFIRSRGRFEPEGELAETGFLASLPGMISLPSGDSAQTRVIRIVIVGVIILAITLCYRRWQLRAFFVIAGVVAVAAVLWAFTLQTAKRATDVAQTAAPDAQYLNGMDADDYVAETMDAAGALFDDEAGASEGEPAPEMAKSERSEAENQPAAPADLDALMEAPNVQAPSAPAQVAGGEFGDADVAVVDPRSGITAGGLLSVPVQFEQPVGAIMTRLHYDGSGAPGVDDLDLSYQDRGLAVCARAAIAVFMALLLWWMRNRGAGWRVLFVTLGVLAPVAVAPLAPVEWQLVLEGIFFGTLAGLVLWLVPCLTCLCSRLRQRIVAAAILIAALTSGLQPDSAAAQEKPQATAQADESRLIVPYEADGVPLMADRVFLPYGEFLELWRRANPDKVATAPENGMVSTAAYAARLIPNPDGTGRVEVRARFILHSFRSEPVSVPLPLGATAIRGARLNGETAALQVRQVVQQQASQKAKNAAPTMVSRYEVLVPTTGASVLDVDFDVPVKLTGPAGRFSVALGTVAAGQFTFTLPASDLQVRVNGSSRTWTLRPTDDGPALDVPVNRGGVLTVEWQPKDEGGSADRVVHADLTTAAVLSDAGLLVRSQINYRVRQGEIGEITFAMPASARLRRVTGADVGGWQIEDDGMTRNVTVFLRRQVSDATTLNVELFSEQSVSQDSVGITIPQARPAAVTRETGQLAVLTSGPFTIRPATIEGGTQIEATSIKFDKSFELQGAKPALAWRYRVRPFTVAITAQRPRPESTVAADHAVSVERRRLRMTTRFQVALAGAPRSRIALRLPADFLTVDVAATEMSDWYPYLDDGGVELLIVDLNRPMTGNVEVVLTGTIPRNPDEANVSITVPRVEQVTRRSARLGIRVDESYTAVVSDAGGWKATPPDQLPEPLRSVSTIPIRFGFTTSAVAPPAITLSLTQRPPTLFAESATVVNVTDTSVEYAINLKWVVRQSATDRFTFTGPEWLAGRIELEATGVRQLIESPPADGRVRWTIVLQEPRSDQYFAMAVATFPPIVNEPLRAPVVSFDVPEGATENPVAVQTHYAIVVNQSERLLTPVGAAAQTADKSQLTITIPDEYLNRATGIVSVDAANPPVWNVTTPPRQEAAPAIVNLAELTTVASSDGSWRTQAVYTLRNRSRQFLPLILPEGAQLLSVFVKGQPARPVTATRKGVSLHLVALPRTSEADLSFDVRVVLGGQLDAIRSVADLKLIGHEVRLPVPRILEMKADDEFGIPVALTVWRLHVPKAWHAEIVRGTGKTNLAEQQDDDVSVIRMRTRVREAVDQSFAFNKSSNMNQKILALGNLKKAEQELARESTVLQDSRLDDELGTLRDNLFTLERELESKGIIAEDTGGEALRNWQVQSQSEEQRRNVRDWNRLIIGSNSATAAPVADKDFGFELQWREQAQKADGQTAVDRDAVSKALMNRRSRSGEKSVSQLKQQLGDQQVRLRNERNDISNNAANQNSDPFSFGVQIDLPELAGQQQGQQQQEAQPQGGGRGVQFNQPAAGNVPAFGSRQLQFDPNTRRAVPQRAAGAFENFARDGGLPAPGDGGGGMAPGARGFRGGGGGGFGGGGFGGQAGVGGGLGQPANGQIASEEDFEADDFGLGLNGRDGEAMPQAWTRAGGLSLPLDISSDTVPITLSKVGGAPQLTINVRPARTLRKGYGLIWAVVWLGIALTALRAFRRHRTAGLLKFLPWAAVVAGVLGSLLLDGDLAQAAFILFIVGAVFAGIVHRNDPARAASRAAAAGSES